MSRQASREQPGISAATAGIVNQILDGQLPPVMKTLSPRKINGFRSEERFTVPRFEHMKDDQFDQYTVSGPEGHNYTTSKSSSNLDGSAAKQYKLQVPEYICFINRDAGTLPGQDQGLNNGSLNLPIWKKRKRKAPPSRVKSMDELMLEESMRRNKRSSQPTIPDLRVMGNIAPGYQCKWERFQHLPDIRPANNQHNYERQPTGADTKALYGDADANFSQNRVEEILKSEGFISPDSGLGLSHPSEESTSPYNQVSSILIDDDFLKSKNLTTSRGHNHRRAEPKMFRIQNSRVENSQHLRASSKKTPANMGESLAILHTRKRLPSLVTQQLKPTEPVQKPS